MLDLVVMASFAAALFVAALVPGPAAAYCVAAGLERRHGLSLWAPAGVTLGKLVHLSVAALGAMWLVRLPRVVRFGLLGMAAAYMVVEGLRRWQLADRVLDASTANHRPAHHVAWRGFLISVANPQSLASSLAILPLFAPAIDSGMEWAMLLGAGAFGVALSYLLYELLARMVAGRVGDRALRRMAGATYLLAGGAMAALAVI